MSKSNDETVRYMVEVANDTGWKNPEPGFFYNHKDMAEHAAKTYVVGEYPASRVVALRVEEFFAR